MATFSDWEFIENQSDLDGFNNRFYWGEDARGVEFYGCLTNESYFPGDISRSGFANTNLHLLVELNEHKNVSDPPYVELVLIHCDHIDLSFITHPYFNGHVDSLKRVVLGDSVRCSRLIYRYIYEDLALQTSAYFRHVDSVS